MIGGAVVTMYFVFVVVPVLLGVEASIWVMSSCAVECIRLIVCRLRGCVIFCFYVSYCVLVLLFAHAAHGMMGHTCLLGGVRSVPFVARAALERGC